MVSSANDAEKWRSRLVS